MTSMHPHWQTTDDENEVPVRIVASAAQKSPATPIADMPRARRGPAALIGVALFFGLGFAAFRGVGGMIGQLLEGEGILVSLNTDSVDPPLLTLRRGEKVTWVNNDTIPHILSSDTLPTEDGDAFLSTAILPDGKFTYTVPAHAVAAMHDYISRTSPAITGQIIIDPTVAQASSSSEAYSSEASSVTTAMYFSSASSAYTYSAPSSYPPEVFPPTMPAGMNIASSSSSTAWNAGGTIAQNGVPQNPYTIGNTTTTPPLRGGAPLAPTTTATVTQHRPTAQPATGTGAWLTGLMTLAAFAVVYRKALAR